MKTDKQIIINNRKAFRDYAILETLECGIELKGSEVKSLREAKASLDDSFAKIENEEVFLYNMHINPYLAASYQNVDPLRVRKLLLKKGQINKFASKTKEKGLTLIPLKLYFNKKGFAKIELALGRGKKFFDKREDIKKREFNLKVKRILKNR
ncbi:MAG: SsrA-binding protein SmpB [Candidatus Omnitrophota bacterium]